MSNYRLHASHSWPCGLLSHILSIVYLLLFIILPFQQNEAQKCMKLTDKIPLFPICEQMIRKLVLVRAKQGVCFLKKQGVCVSEWVWILSAGCKELNATRSYLLS